MGLDDRLKPLIQRPFRTEPVPGARGGVDAFNPSGGGQGGGTAETIIEPTVVGSRKINPQELGLVKPFVIQSGTTLDDMTGFQHHGIRIDNLTPQWMRIHGILDHYVPPWTFGIQFPVMAGSTKAWITWEAPIGLSQPAAGSTGVTALVYFTEAYLYPTPGIDISSFVAGGIAQLTNITQWASANVLQASAANLATNLSTGAIFAAAPGEWGQGSTAATGSRSITTKAAVAGTRHVARGVTVSASSSAALAGVSNVDWLLRDGAVDVGTIIWLARWLFAAAIIPATQMVADGMNIVGSVNTAMCLHGDPATGNLSQSVSLTGYDAV